MGILVESQYRRIERAERRSKRRTVGGISFKTHDQANRYTELKALEHAGRITELKHNAPYPLLVPKADGSGKALITTYRATFSYKQDGQLVLIEMNPPTDVYRLKKELVKALLLVDICEAY